MALILSLTTAKAYGPEILYVQLWETQPKWSGKLTMVYIITQIKSHMNVKHTLTLESYNHNTKFYTWCLCLLHDVTVTQGQCIWLQIEGQNFLAYFQGQKF